MCPSGDEVRRYLNDELEEADREAVYAHLEQCEDCRLCLDALEAADEAVANRIRDAIGIGLLCVNAAPLAGAHLGRYRLLQKIGEGGMGEVWLARQTEPVERDVAVKFVKIGKDSQKALERFDDEQRALALMVHPNIARVYDFGLTGAGRPFLVMEPVKGEPITKYCDDRRLAPNKRLELFNSVCRAVAHAHQRAIIHRDIKPANVLVAECDDRPVAKVIDFGLAKATGLQLNPSTPCIEPCAIVGTLDYMSPEQATSKDIDVRSDVYSLGALLYELLTGTTPFGKNRLGQAALDDALWTIEKDDPPRPSARLRTAVDLPKIAQDRRLKPWKLIRLMRADLDWVVMKALMKDREDRYATPNELAQEIERYLAGEPVSARRSAPYQLRKFTCKHRIALAAAAAFAAGVSIVSGVASREIRLEWDRQGEARRLLMQAEYSEAVFKRDLNLTEGRLASQKAGAAVRWLRSPAAHWLRSWDPVELRERADLLVQRLDGELSTFYASSQSLEAAQDLFQRHDIHEAERRANDALASWPQNSQAYCLLSAIHERRGHLDLALSTIEKAEEVRPTDHSIQLGILHVLDLMGRREEVKARLLDMTKTAFPNVSTWYGLACYQAQALKGYDDAIATLEQAVKVFPKDVNVRYALASYRFQAGGKRRDDAIATLRDAAKDFPEEFNVLIQLASYQWVKSKDQAIETLRQGTRASWKDAKAARYALGSSLAWYQSQTDGERRREAIATAQALVKDFPSDLDARYKLASYQYQAGDAYYDSALKTLRRAAKDFPNEFNFLIQLASYQAAKSKDQAIETLRQAMTAFKQSSKARYELTGNLAWYQYQAGGKTGNEEAIATARLAVTEFPKDVTVRYWLAWYQYQAGYACYDSALSPSARLRSSFLKSSIFLFSGPPTRERRAIKMLSERYALPPRNFPENPTSGSLWRGMKDISLGISTAGSERFVRPTSKFPRTVGSRTC
jgi:serine/threonine protein kinase/Flp pilus assembly protein TadD